MRTRASCVSGLAFLAGALILVGYTGSLARQMHTLEPLVQGPGVAKATRLSEYFPGLAGSPGDTEVYILEGREPGGTMLVLGTTHGLEPSGMVATTLLVENAVPAKGRLILIPHADRSNLTWNEPGQGHPSKFEIETASGKRWFRFGARYTNPVHQWPDPEVYVHYPSGQQLSGEEARNLNRAWPGKPDGTFTQKVAYGICELIRKENVDVAIDIHEAPPEKPLIDAITAHQRAMLVAGLASMNLELEGIKMRLEASPTNLHGLSHREWGDHTQVLAFLLETPNAAQGGIRGITNAELIVKGKDPCYERAAKLGRTFVPFGPEGHPLESRVGKDLATIMAIAAAYTEVTPDRPIVVENVPSAADLLANGLGHYLREIE